MFITDEQKFWNKPIFNCFPVFLSQPNKTFCEGKANPYAVWCSSALLTMLSKGDESHFYWAGIRYFLPTFKRSEGSVFYSYPLKKFSEKTILLNFKNYFVRCCIKCLILIEGASVFSFWNMMISWLWHILFFMILCNSRFSKWSQRCGCENFI